MFTGSIIEKGGLFHAFYTNWNPKNPKGREFISHATSKDMIAWEKHPEDMFGPDGIHYANHRMRDFRDPAVVWDDEAGEYVMYLKGNYTNKDKTAKGPFGTGVLRSKDLKTWRQCPALAGIGSDECPDFFKSGETYYLHGCNVYAYAKSKEGPWKYAALRHVDRRMAAKRVFDGKRHVWFGGWLNGPMSVAREVYEGPNGLLFIKPVPEVINAFDQTHTSISGKEIAANTPLDVDVPDDYLLDAVVEMKDGGQLTVTMRDKSQVQLIATPDKKELHMKGYRTTLLPTVDPTEPIKIQAIVVDNVIEFFVNDKFAASSSRVPKSGACKLTCDKPILIEELKIKTFELPRIE
jgi:beta-fructofuranosidase